MPFGLTNASTTFIGLMNRTFYKYFYEFVIVFGDDILIYFNNEQLHEKHLKIALNLLMEIPLYAMFSLSFR